MRRHSPGSNVDLPQSAPVRLRLSCWSRNASNESGLSATFTKATQSFDPLKARVFSEGVMTTAGMGVGVAASATAVGVGRSVGSTVEVALGRGVAELISATDVADGMAAATVLVG